MMFLFISVSMLYLAFVLVIIIAWHWIPGVVTSRQPGNFPSVSVIIPVRNEASHIGKLLKQIISQDYPNDQFEVIVVNDHSTDETISVIERVNNSEVSLGLINLKKSKEGKKAALTEGISTAKGEIIITTDADCEVGEKWLKTISNAFDNETMMVFGPVAIRSDNLFDRLQMMDFAALTGLGAATWKLGMSGMCNGANLAFRKIVFEQCKGYEGNEQHPSGDDEFLLRKVHKRYRKAIGFVKSKAAVVLTDAQPDIRSFVQQRIRWAGKWKLHKDIITKLLAIFVFFYYVLMLIVTGWMFFINKNINIIAGIWAVKWLLDVLLIGSVLKLSRQRLSVVASMMLSLIYPFYAIATGISTINYTFKWKDRRY